MTTDEAFPFNAVQKVKTGVSKPSLPPEDAEGRPAPPQADNNIPQANTAAQTMDILLRLLFMQSLPF
ncbi:hypothetical protein HMSSN036_49920 [Paenibacillus macerans]|nr:hypothetical protein HMSSN036_49920 [Paenibacillus macerans]